MHLLASSLALAIGRLACLFERHFSLNGGCMHVYVQYTFKTHLRLITSSSSFANCNHLSENGWPAVWASLAHNIINGENDEY